MAGRLTRFQLLHESKFISFEGGTHRVLDPAKDKLVGSFFNIERDKVIRDVPESFLIYVRQDLVDLYDAVLDDIRRRKRTWRVYIGNSGTGKSLAGIQLLFVLLKLHSDNPVVYYSHKLGPGVYHLFEGGKFHSLLDFAAVTDYLESSETFYIHDESEIPASGIILARTVLVTSPEPSVYKEFCNVSEGYQVFYGRLWTEEELKACWERAYSRIEWQTVAYHLYMAGPIPRLVFQPPKSFNTLVAIMKSKLAQTSHLLLLFSLIGDHDLEQSFSHELLHLDRGKDLWVGYRKIASDYVKEQLLLRLDKENWREMIAKYTSLRGVGGLASFRGTVMELLMHITFPKFLGKCERICSETHQHSTAAPARLNVDEAEDLKVVFYVDFEDLQAKIEKCIRDKCARAYFWPRTKFKAAIDSIYIDFKLKWAYLLQATVSKEHAVVWHPVKLLMVFLSSKKIRIAGLYFVVADTIFSAFKAQRWRKVKGEYPEMMKIPSLCQYKLEFSVLDDDWKNIERLSDNMDDNFKLTLSMENDMPEEHVRRKRMHLADDSSSSYVVIEPDCELDITEVNVLAGELYEQENQ